MLDMLWQPGLAVEQVVVDVLDIEDQKVMGEKGLEEE